LDSRFTQNKDYEMITDKTLATIAGRAKPHALMAPIAAAINKYAAQYGVMESGDLARFLANSCVETAGFTALEENLNYSIKGLLGTFGRHRISVSDANKYGRTKTRPANKEAIANIIYGGDFGRKQLGNILPGDGWKYRGSGAKQTTGRANFEAVQRDTGLPVVNKPDILRTDVDAAVRAAFVFWRDKGLSKITDITASRKKVNGGTNGLDDAKAAYVRALKLDLSVPPVVKNSLTVEPKPIPVDVVESQKPPEVIYKNPSVSSVDNRANRSSPAVFMALITTIGLWLLSTVCTLPQWLLDFTGLAAKCVQP
jgi:putative chitinase